MDMNVHYKDFSDELATLIDSQDYFQPPPSAYHFNACNSRQTPSPQQQQQHPHQHQPYAHPHHLSRSRSRSRPPSSSESASTGSIGPARRNRRNNSVSGTSPPPPYARPHAIVIPATRSGNGNGWFSQSSASDFSLATPSSEMGAHQTHSPLSYTPFSIPDQPQKANSIDFSLYHHHQSSPPPSAYPYSPSSSVPLTLANHHQPNCPNANSLAGALSSSLPIQPSSMIQHSATQASLGHPPSLASPFGVPPSNISPYTVGGPSSASPTSPSAVPPPNHTLSHPPPTTIPAAALSPQDKQALLASEKRRRRRESHNAVERRRRDNINEKITELATLIPECMLEGGSVAANNGGSVSPSTDGHSNFLDGTDPLLPASLAGLKREDVVNEEGDPISPNPATCASGEAAVVKANKGMILRKSVEYIRYLQQLVTAQGVRNRELEQELKAYRSGGAPNLNLGSSPLSSGPPISALGTSDSSSTLTLNTAITHPNVHGKRRQNSSRSNNSIKRTKPSSPSTRSRAGDDLDEKDLPLLPDEHDRDDHDHDHDESSDPEGEYEDDLGDNGHFAGMLGGMAGMSGMVLVEEGMRLEFPVSQLGQATRGPAAAAGPRGRRTARRTSSASIGSNVDANHHQPIHSSHQQPPHTMQNIQGMNMTMNLTMFPDGLGMSVPVSVPAGMTTDMSMEVDPREHDAQAAAAAAAVAAIERGRPSIRPASGGGGGGGVGGPMGLAQKRGYGRANGHPNGGVAPMTTGNPHGLRLKEEMVDVGVVALGLGSGMGGMGMGLLPMGMST